MYLVTVTVKHDDKEVFFISEEFTDKEDRDFMRAFLNETGSRIESYDYHFDDDDTNPDNDGEYDCCPHGFVADIAGCPFCEENGGSSFSVKE